VIKTAMEEIVSTLIQMMKDRGHNVLLADETANGMTVRRFANEDSSRCCGIVVLKECKRVGVATARILIPVMKKLGCTEGVLATPTKITASALNEFGQYIQNFTHKQLRSPVVNHALVPHHRALSDSEGHAIFDELAVTPEQMPVLLSTDPVARYYNFKPTQVIEIVRRNGFHVPVKYYRIVR
jgi:DNA-directed RNA polymerase subunit H